MWKFIRGTLVALGALTFMGGLAALANYTATQGTGTTFGSVVVGGVHYAQHFLCDLTTPAQCAGVNASGQVAIAGPVTNAGTFATQLTGATNNINNIAGTVSLPTGASTSALQTTGNTSLSTIATNTTNAATTTLQTAGNASLATIATNTGAATPAGTNVIGYTTPDPCSQGTRINKPISQTTNTNLITGTSAKKLYICAISLITADAENISFVEGTTGGTCGTSTAAVIGSTSAANGMNLAANGGFTIGSGLGTVANTATNATDLCLFQSGSGRIAGNLMYVVQ